MAEQMKPSGIDWIGDIPDEWDITKVRFVTKLRSEQGFYNSDDKYIGLENISSYTGEYISTESEYDAGIYDLYKTGDLLFSKLRPYLAKALIADDCGFCTGELAVIKEYNGDIRYLFYYMLSDGFLKMVDASTYGAKMPRASWDYIKNLQIPVIGKAEQQAIANFLDKECAQIDSIAADLEKQIALLQQYKKSLITETVTKGLDKSVPMKDSGVEWIGEIPEHWNVLRVKDISKLQTGTTPPGNEGVNFDNDGIQWFTPADFNDGSIKLGLAEKSIDFDTIHRENIKAYPANTVLFIGIASIGKIGFSPNTCYSNQQITGIKPNNNKNGKYIAYSLLAGMDSIKDNALYTTVPIVNNAYLGNIKISFPPTNEQETITKYLDYATSSVDEIIGKKLEQLSTIQQHKKSLIYEYVTGKKRVKEVQ